MCARHLRQNSVLSSAQTGLGSKPRYCLVGSAAATFGRVLAEVDTNVDEAAVSLPKERLDNFGQSRTIRDPAAARTADSRTASRLASEA